MIGEDDDIVVSEFNQQVRRHSIRRLRPGQWLDDEVRFIHLFIFF